MPISSMCYANTSGLSATGLQLAPPEPNDLTIAAMFLSARQEIACGEPLNSRVEASDRRTVVGKDSESIEIRVRCQRNSNGYQSWRQSPQMGFSSLAHL